MFFLIKFSWTFLVSFWKNLRWQRKRSKYFNSAYPKILNRPNMVKKRKHYFVGLCELNIICILYESLVMFYWKNGIHSPLVINSMRSTTIEASIQTFSTFNFLWIKYWNLNINPWKHYSVELKYMLHLYLILGVYKVLHKLKNKGPPYT